MSGFLMLCNDDVVYESVLLHNWLSNRPHMLLTNHSATCPTCLNTQF